MKNLLMLVTMAFCAIAVNAQENPEMETVSLPDHVMSKIVERIVTEHFNGGSRSRTAYFSEQNINREWMPKMAKITFVFVDSADGKEVHFFKEPMRDGDIYQIDFGWGDPECSAIGETWQFRIVDGRVLDLLRTNSGWGMGCGSSRGFARSVPTIFTTLRCRFVPV